MINFDKNKLTKALVIILGLLAIALAIYILVAPWWPVISYKISQPQSAKQTDWQNISAVREQASRILNNLPQAEDSQAVNRLLIPKIGVNIPIVEGENDNALERGAWRLPQSSTPDRGGNTVITGHRFKYLPPNNFTFYLLDKLAPGDIMTVDWQGKNYFYRIKETKIVAKDDLSITDPSNDSIITVFTCHPIFSQDQRLVVIGELIKE